MLCDCSTDRAKREGSCPSIIGLSAGRSGAPCPRANLMVDSMLRTMDNGRRDPDKRTEFPGRSAILQQGRERRELLGPAAGECSMDVSNREPRRQLSRRSGFIRWLRSSLAGYTESLCIVRQLLSWRPTRSRLGVYRVVLLVAFAGSLTSFHLVWSGRVGAASLLRPWSHIAQLEATAPLIWRRSDLDSAVGEFDVGGPAGVPTASIRYDLRVDAPNGLFQGDGMSLLPVWPGPVLTIANTGLPPNWALVTMEVHGDGRVLQTLDTEFVRVELPRDGVVQETVESVTGSGTTKRLSWLTTVPAGIGLLDHPDQAIAASYDVSDLAAGHSAALHMFVVASMSVIENEMVGLLPVSPASQMWLEIPATVDRLLIAFRVIAGWSGRIAEASLTLDPDIQFRSLERRRNIEATRLAMLGLLFVSITVGIEFVKTYFLRSEN